uniref:SRP40_C domain-containing protein n=1 Tax=Panagrellus redivivus TaxID=6233 RepID=A0A7E4VNQ8_PANRE
MAIFLLTIVLTRFALTLCVCLDVFNTTASRKAQTAIKKAKKRKRRLGKTNKYTKSTTSKSKSKSKSSKKKDKKKDEKKSKDDSKKKSEKAKIVRLGVSSRSKSAPSVSKSKSKSLKVEKAPKVEKPKSQSFTKRIKQKLSDITSNSSLRSSAEKVKAKLAPKKPVRRESSSTSIKAASLDKDVSPSFARAKVVSFQPGSFRDHSQSTTQKYEKATTHWIGPPPGSTDGRLYKSDDCPTPNPFKPIKGQEKSHDSNQSSLRSLRKMPDPFIDSKKVSKPLSPTSSKGPPSEGDPAKMSGKLYNPNQVPAAFKTDNADTAKAVSPPSNKERGIVFPLKSGKNDVTAPMNTTRSATNVTSESSIRSSDMISDSSAVSTTAGTSKTTDTTASASKTSDSAASGASKTTNSTAGTSKTADSAPSEASKPTETTTTPKTAPVPTSQTKVTLKDLTVPSPTVAPTPTATDPTQSFNDASISDREPKKA